MSASARPRVLCVNGCRSYTYAPDRLCTDCSAKLTDGAWVPHRSVLRWVPRGDTLATAAGQRRYREVLTERYFTPEWFARPAPDTDLRRCEDTEMACARRLRDALAEADEHDRHREGVA
jgi:hypothetical protein